MFTWIPPSSDPRLSESRCSLSRGSRGLAANKLWLTSSAHVSHHPALFCAPFLPTAPFPAPRPCTLEPTQEAPAPLRQCLRSWSTTRDPGPLQPSLQAAEVPPGHRPSAGLCLDHLRPLRNTPGSGDREHVSVILALPTGGFGDQARAQRGEVKGELAHHRPSRKVSRKQSLLRDQSCETIVGAQYSPDAVITWAAAGSRAAGACSFPWP